MIQKSKANEKVVYMIYECQEFIYEKHLNKKNLKTNSVFLSNLKKKLKIKQMLPCNWDATRKGY